MSLFGPVRFARAYYHCGECHQGHVPFDHQAGLGPRQLTPAASQLACLAGVKESFAQSAEVSLQKMCGLRLSESTVERVTEETGARLAKLLAEGKTFGEAKPWKWQRDARGRTCAYVGVDATGIRQQGPGGKQAEGRMAYVGMLYNPRVDRDSPLPREPHQVRYLAGFYELDELGLQLRRQAAQIGWEEAEQQLFFSDGGSGLEEFARKNFPLAECILDFWHAKEYLVEERKALFGETPEGQTWQAEMCHRLKHEGGQTVLTLLESLDVSSRSAAVQEVHQTTLTYYRNNVHRMDYPRYLANGWEIGSGPVESACGTVVGDRLKGSGMRWGEFGSDGVSHLRALQRSEPTQWTAFWEAHPN